MRSLRRWMSVCEAINQRLVESEMSFVDHLQDAVEATEAGFHYEEGGCWGMALALYDAFQALGKHPQLMIATGHFAHAMVQVDDQLYDYRGVVYDAPPAKPITRAGLMRGALRSGHSVWDVRGDAIAAAEIIQTAAHWDDD